MGWFPKESIGKSRILEANHLILLIILFFLVIYLLFPTNNSSIDAYYYAASIKHSGEMFHPHHLLYNYTGSLFLKITQVFGFSPDVLTFLKSLNALIAALCLFIVNRILVKLGKDPGEIAGFLILSGSNFAIWRFATENETYIFPLAFSLLASLGFINYLKNQKPGQIVLSGIAASIAVLYHQIHLFWWVILLVGLVVYFRRWKVFLLYSLPAILIPVGYILVFTTLRNKGEVEGPFIQFILRDFYTGGVDMTFGWSNLYLTVINVFRSYLQVHGMIFTMIRKSILFLLPAILATILFVTGVLQKGLFRKRIAGTSGIFIKIHVFIFVIQLIFAVYAVGNAEFMVMLPVLSFLVVAALFNFKKRSLYLAGIGLFIWNFSYGILPVWKVDHTPHKNITEWVILHKSDLFVLMSDQDIISKIYYSSGNEVIPNIRKAPEAMVSRNQSFSVLQEEIDEHLVSGNRVFTDCLDRPEVITREQLLDHGINHEFFSRYSAIPVDSVNTLLGTYYLHEVLDKWDPSLNQGE